MTLLPCIQAGGVSLISNTEDKNVSASHPSISVWHGQMKPIFSWITHMQHNSHIAHASQRIADIASMGKG
jgi:hypothetical protein